MSERTNIAATARASLRTGNRFVEIAPVSVIVVNPQARVKARKQDTRPADRQTRLRSVKPERTGRAEIPYWLQPSRKGQL